MKIVVDDIVAMAFAGELDVIVQGCNCFCRMGRGLALTIREEFPEAVAADMTTKPGDLSKLGTYSVGYHRTQTGHEIAVINAYTQPHWDGNGTEIIADYNAIRSCMKKIREKLGHKRIGIPLIGAGLARGNWAEIEKIILEELGDCVVTIVHFGTDFEKLLSRYDKETQFQSNPSAGLYTYVGRKLIESGDETVRYIFGKYSGSANIHLMALLHRITGENPVPRQCRGDVDTMWDCWNRWATNHLY